MSKVAIVFLVIGALIVAGCLFGCLVYKTPEERAQDDIDQIRYLDKLKEEKRRKAIEKDNK